MTQLATTISVAWGLELGPAAAHLLRVERQTTGLKIERRPAFDTADFCRTGLLDPQLVAALKQIPAGEPLAVCFPDDAMLCRGFSLPAAPRDVMDKMVHAQVDSLLSTGQDRLTTTWRDFPDPVNDAMRWVVFCAVRRDLVDQLNAALPAGVTACALLPRAMAAAHASPPAAASDSQLLLEINDDAATMGLWIQGHLLRCMVLHRDDSGADSTWLRNSRQTYQSLMEGLPRPRWPKQGLIRGNNGQAAKLSPAVSQSLGIELAPWPWTSADGTPDDNASSSCGAVGAARLLLEDAAANTNFAKSQAPATALKPPVKQRLFKLAAICAVGLVLLYSIDCYRAWWLDRQVEQVRLAEASSGGIEQRLAVDRYLEREASPALPGLDAILSAAPQSLTMSSFGVSTTGQFHFVGGLQNPGELDAFLKKLQQSPVLNHVELHSGRAQQQGWQLDLTASASPTAGLMIINPPKLPAVAPAASPATQPAKRGAK